MPENTIYEDKAFHPAMILSVLTKNFQILPSSYYKIAEFICHFSGDKGYEASFLPIFDEESELSLEALLLLSVKVTMIESAIREKFPALASCADALCDEIKKIDSSPKSVIPRHDLMIYLEKEFGEKIHVPFGIGLLAEESS